MPSRRRWLLSLVAIAGGCRAARYVPTYEYAVCEVGGFRVFVAPRAAHAPRTDSFLDLLALRLEEFRRAVRRDAFESVRDVAFWIELDERGRAMAGYHGLEWIRRHALNPDKARAIEIADRDAFWEKLAGDSPSAVEHELAHAYLDRVDVREPLRVAFEHAVSSGAYARVRTRRGSMERAYALESAAEYFAELTEAYLGENDFEPFDRASLAPFDPRGFALVRAAWG